MGLFGNGDTKTYTTKKTYTTLTQEDKSVAAAGDAEKIVGAGARLIEATDSTIVERPNTTSGDIIISQFPEAVQNTVGSLIKAVESSTQTVGQALTTQQIGGESQLSKIVLYMMVGFGVMIFANKFFKR